MIQAPHVGHRQAAALWGNELTQGLVSCGLVVETVSRCCFRHHSGSVAGAVHGDLIFVAGPRGSLELGDVHLLDALTRESPVSLHSSFDCLAPFSASTNRWTYRSGRPLNTDDSQPLLSSFWLTTALRSDGMLAVFFVSHQTQLLPPQKRKATKQNKRESANEKKKKTAVNVHSARVEIRVGEPASLVGVSP